MIATRDDDSDTSKGTRTRAVSILSYCTSSFQSFPPITHSYRSDFRHPRQSTLSYNVSTRSPEFVLVLATSRYGMSTELVRMGTVACWRAELLFVSRVASLKSLKSSESQQYPHSQESTEARENAPRASGTKKGKAQASRPRIYNNKPCYLQSHRLIATQEQIVSLATQALQTILASPSSSAAGVS
eukprot:scaffold218291_cov34-Prasinocladus_malaysianus.AAC.2